MAGGQEWQIRYRLRGSNGPYQWILTWNREILGRDAFADLIAHLGKIHPDWEIALFLDGEIVQE